MVIILLENFLISTSSAPEILNNFIAIVCVICFMFVGIQQGVTHSGKRLHTVEGNTRENAN